MPATFTRFEDFLIDDLKLNFDEFVEKEKDRLHDEYTKLKFEFVQKYLSTESHEEIDGKCKNLVHDYKSIKEYKNFTLWMYDNFVDISQFIYLAELEDHEDFQGIIEIFRNKVVIEFLEDNSIKDYQGFLDVYLVFQISQNLLDII
jgi:hypothetical protein